MSSPTTTSALTSSDLVVLVLDLPTFIEVMIGVALGVYTGIWTAKVTFRLLAQGWKKSSAQVDAALKQSSRKSHLQRYTQKYPTTWLPHPENDLYLPPGDRERANNILAQLLRDNDDDEKQEGAAEQN